MYDEGLGGKGRAAPSYDLNEGSSRCYGRGDRW